MASSLALRARSAARLTAPGVFEAAAVLGAAEHERDRGGQRDAAVGVGCADGADPPYGSVVLVVCGRPGPPALDDVGTRPAAAAPGSGGRHPGPFHRAVLARPGEHRAVAVSGGREDTSVRQRRSP